MYSFKNDYSEGAHPKVLAHLLDTNLVQQAGYGEDAYCAEATALIQHKIGNTDSEIHYVSGGTQANLLVLSALMKPFEAVICAESGHIAVHETGAIEATGHKVLTVSAGDGKLTPALIKPVIAYHSDEHMVLPRVVYISNTTEIGTIYSKKELQELYAYCQEQGLILYLDGARLGSALTAVSNELTLADLSAFTDIFYIGGTKNGALLGEAIVINNKMLITHFRFSIKQRGALLAKGRLLGTQFSALFTDDLFFEIAQHANQQAMVLARGFQEKGFKFLTEPVSNQIFPIVPNTLLSRLQEDFDFHCWQKIDQEHTCIRLVTSWATTDRAVADFLQVVADHKR